MEPFLNQDSVTQQVLTQSCMLKCSQFLGLQILSAMFDCGLKAVHDYGGMIYKGNSVHVNNKIITILYIRNSSLNWKNACCK